jgi:hypothetical protein
VATVSQRYGYQDEAAVHVPSADHHSPLHLRRPADASSTRIRSIGGPAQSVLSHFTHALASSRPGGTLPAAAGGSEAGAAGVSEAEGIGAVAEEAAPLLQGGWRTCVIGREHSDGHPG